MRYALLCISSLVVLGLACSQGNAIVSWPSDTDWHPLLVGGSVYTDVPEDENPNDIDVVGNIVGLSDHAAGFWYLDATNLYLRMRVADSGITSKKVWMFMMDTADIDSVSGHDIIDLSLQLDQDKDNRLELVLTDNGGPNWTSLANADKVSVSSAAADVLWTGDKATYTRWVLISDYTIPGSSPASDNYYLDAYIPWATLKSLATANGKPISDISDIALALCSSASHSGVVNKDHPDSETVAGYLSDPLMEPTTSEIVPEPASIMGLMMGVTGGLGVFFRRRFR